MSASALWHPVLSTQALRAGQNAVAALLDGQPLALWRSSAGAVQAWDDRCPHRSVPLSLGRIKGERLACAYHGWEYAAADGRCVAIPAMPLQPVPGKVCVRTYPALERQGLVWVNLAPSAPHDLPPDPQAAAGFFLRSLGVGVPLALADGALQDAGFDNPAPHVWYGMLDGAPTRLYTLSAAPQWSLLHLFCDQAPSPDQWPRRFGAIRALRAAIEPRTGPHHAVL